MSPSLHTGIAIISWYNGSKSFHNLRGWILYREIVFVNPECEIILSLHPMIYWCTATSELTGFNPWTKALLILF